MPAHLLSLADGPSILLDKPILLFGRHEECDVQLNSKKVSRRHCILAQVNNDYLVIRDLGSTNGVRINGQRVAEGKLRPGDEVQIGNFKYQVCGDMLGRSKEHASAAEEYPSVPPTVKESPPAAPNEKSEDRADASEQVSADDDSSAD
jgi:pSer/pThr/pTyr-binding forkhead associated (FHA) protein